MEFDLMKKEQYNAMVSEFITFAKTIESLLGKMKGQSA
jgi:hypothetical protein